MSAPTNKWLSSIDWKTWLLLGTVGVAGVTAAALAIQWNHASLGRQVSRNVVRFLTDHGGMVSNGIISGGLVQTPLKLNTAVNATVVSMLNNMADQLGGGEEGVGDPAAGAGAPGIFPDEPTYARAASKPVAVSKPAAGSGGGGRRGRQSPAAAGAAKADLTQYASPRGRGAMSNAPFAVGQAPDDGGYSQSGAGGGGGKQGRRRQHEGPPQEGGAPGGDDCDYNPDEFRPAHLRKPPSNVDIFAPDGGESAVAAAMAGGGQEGGEGFQ